MDLKKILLFVVACLAVVFTAGAQQQGMVRSLERPKQPSKGIAGATVSILELKNDLVTDKEGKFSFTIRDKNSFKVTRVQKKGYTLVDKQLLGRKFSYSSVPIEIVMVSDKQLASDKKLIEDKAYDRAKKTYEARIAELERQLAEKTITEKAYYAEREVAINDYDKYVQLIDEMAERYAMTDYKGLSDINRQIQECIENAELERADSLINSKGDFDQREQELLKKKETTQRIEELYNKSQEDYQYTLNDLARDYYNKYTIFAAIFRNDSAAYWLERRANLDATNIVWQNDAGCFLKDYLANYTLAMEYYQRGLREAIVKDGEQSDWAATFYNNIGLVYYEQGEYDQALEYYNKALEIDEKLLGKDNPSTATSYNNIGTVYEEQGEYDQVLEYKNKALDIREKVLGEDHPETAISYNSIGTVYYYQRDYIQALEYLHKALDIREKVLGENHPETGQSYNNIGVVYDNLGDYAQALEYHNKALDIRKKVLGEDHPETAISYNNIGGAYYEQGEYTQALGYYNKALEIYEKVLGGNHPETALSYNNIGLIYNEQGDYVQALEYYKKALEIHEKVLGGDHLHTATSYNNIGWVYRKQGDYKKALEYFEKAYVIRQQKLGEYHPDTKDAKSSIRIMNILLDGK